jgi:hypothetical protein
MRDGPTQRVHSPKLVPADKRRAQLVAQMQEQAIAVANADRLAIKASTIRHSRWRKADGIIATGVLKMMAATIIIAALGSIIALALLL